MTEYETHAAFVELLEAEVSRLWAVNAELMARGESTSLRQRADAWMAVCALLRELRPNWQEGPGCAQEQALKAIRAMAAQPARQPLTDEEIIALGDKARAAEGGDAGYILPISFARAVEKAHGIGGEA